MTDLLTIRSLSKEQIQNLLSLSQSIKKNPSAYSEALKGKTILQFFAENSTRTKLSFETAVKHLGGTNMSFSASASSLKKGESLLDTVQTIRQYGVHAVVLRHRAGLAPEFLADALEIPVMNAGDGRHEHPTQALLDGMTLQEHWKDESAGCEGKRVMILGDILHSRVARSNIHLMTKLGMRVTLCAPQTLLPSDLSLFPKVEVVHHPDELLPETDAVYLLRIQFERQNGLHIPSQREYRHFWGLTRERFKCLKPDAVVLHPGPMNRGLEIDSDVADDPRTLVLKQVENGVWVRAAVMHTLLCSSLKEQK